MDAICASKKHPQAFSSCLLTEILMQVPREHQSMISKVLSCSPIH